jgi:predicted GIY-YIG superfamily endonuclease
MFTPGVNSTILTYRGLTVRLDPPTYFYVYLLHFHSRYYHAGHYIGMTANLDVRLQLHRTGRGAKLTKAVSEAGITFEVSRLWQVDTWEEARALERKLKRRHNGPSLCPICQGKPIDMLVFMRQGHWPLAQHDRQGKRQPMNTHIPTFVHKIAE